MARQGSTVSRLRPWLRKRYPSDAARGYRAGDFRGAFSAEIERTALGPRR
jgi:hypothetical protein